MESNETNQRTHPARTPLVLLGPPGAGKSTQAAQCSKSTGARVWRLRDAGVGRAARASPWAGVLRRRRDPFGWPPLREDVLGWLLGQTLPRAVPLIVENFPGHARHVDVLLTTLAGHDHPPPVVVELTVDAVVALARIAGRRTCPRCSALVTGDPHSPAATDPARPGHCARCGGRLRARLGDGAPLRHMRLARYHRRMARVRKKLAAYGLPVHQIDATAPAVDVQRRIVSAWCHSLPSTAAAAEA